MPWLKITKSTSKFVKCGLCEYLRAQINATPRSNAVLISSLRNRLGAHFEFQSAQRMAQAALEEKCIQSNGLKWLMDIDKMDQQSVHLTIWSQLSSPLYKGGARIMVAINGSLDPPWVRKNPRALTKDFLFENPTNKHNFPHGVP